VVFLHHGFPYNEFFGNIFLLMVFFLCPHGY
jgi:hypothetical protein